MTSSVEKRYTDEIRNRLLFYANYFPNQKLELGDYGQLNGNYFVKLGNIANKGIVFSVGADNDANDMIYSSENALTAKVTGTTEIKLPGDISEFESTIELNFNKQSAIFFKIEKVKSIGIDNLDILGQKIIELYEKDSSWKKEYKVITNLYTSKINNICVSNESGNTAKMKVKSKTELPIGNINIGNISGDISIMENSTLAFSMTGDKDWQTLFRLSGIRDESTWQKILAKLASKKNNFKQFAFSPILKSNNENKINENYYFVDELELSQLLGINT